MTGQLIPLEAATAATLDIAKKANIPIKTMFYDATPQIQELLKQMYAHGYVFMALNGPEDKTAAAALALGSGKRFDV